MSIQEQSYLALNPYLSPEEYILLTQIDPKFKLVADVKADLLNSDNFRQLMSQQPDEYELAQPQDGAANDAQVGLDEAVTTPSQDEEVQRGDGPVGGFALAPFIPLISSVAAPLISEGMSGLFKMIKGRGCDQSGGAILQDFWQKNLPLIKEVEDRLAGSKGKQFWKNSADFAKSQIEMLAPELLGISPVVARHLAQGVVHKFLPKSFLGMAKAKTGSGVHSFDSVVRPVLRWQMRKMVGPEQGDRVYRQLKMAGALKDFEGSGLRPAGVYGYGFFSKVRDIGKKVLQKALPPLVSIGEKALPLAIDAILGKFGVKNELGKQAAQAISKSVYDVGSKELVKKVAGQGKKKVLKGSVFKLRKI